MSSLICRGRLTRRLQRACACSSVCGACDPLRSRQDRHPDGDIAGTGNEDPPSIVALAEMPRVQNHEHVPAADREIRGAKYELVPAADAQARLAFGTIVL